MCSIVTGPYCKNQSWFESIKNIIYQTGQYFIWNSQKALINKPTQTIHKHKMHITKTLKDLFVQYSCDKMATENKLYLFKTAKNHLKPSQYLLSTRNWKTRSLLSKLRLGTTNLEIEKGRKIGIPREQRLCKICNSNLIEDEAHFLFECQALSLTRSTFISQISLF